MVTATSTGLQFYLPSISFVFKTLSFVSTSQFLFYDKRLSKKPSFISLKSFSFSIELLFELFELFEFFELFELFELSELSELSELLIYE